MKRRGFLASLAATAMAPRLGWADAGSPSYLAAAQTATGTYELHGLTQSGDSIFRLPLPARGHAATAHPSLPHAVAFARRPGTFALVIDCARGAELARLGPPDGRQFNGHGAFSADGAVLYTSEQVAETSEGRIGLWSVPGYRRLGEIPSHGTGPHEIRRLPMSDDLLVANGGIATDPTDRTKLNIDRMRPNLARVTPDGSLVSLAEPPEGMHQNSTRHLALLPDGNAACALQWEGDPAEAPPLLALWTEGTLAFCEPPLEEAFTMASYAGSIACSHTTRQIAITSPKGGAVQVFGMDGVFLATYRRADVCGIAAAAGGFLVTDGNGVISRLDADGLKPIKAHPVQWDNHLIALNAV